MKQLSGVVALALTLLLQACLSSNVTLKIAPDGSGRAVIISHVYEQGLQDFQKIFSVAPEDQKNAGESMPPPTEEDLSAQFGTAVTLESTTVEQTADGVIRTTIVNFPDITQVRLQFPPIVVFPADAPGLSSVSEPPVISFELSPHENGNRLLLVHMPENPGETDENAPDAETPVNPALDPNFRRAIAGMTVQFSIELAVPLLRTNAPAWQGNDATILNVDVAKAIENLSEEQRALATTPGSVQKLLWDVGDVPGAVLPKDHEIFLEFASETSSPHATPQPAARPDTEIFLAPLSNRNGRIDVGSPVNISGNDGYDNQPFFTPDGSAVLFSSVRGGTQSDIYRYDIAGGTVTQVTNTPESEYSPTVTPAGNLSVVRVELDKDRSQRLWQFTVDGRGPQVVLDAIKPVGYHVWADDHTLALFVLGQPPTLQVVDTKTGTARIVASDVARSLQLIPGGHTISFVQRDRSADPMRLLIEELNPATGETTLLTPAVAGGDEADLAWTPDRTLLMVRGDVLYAWRRGDAAWRSVAVLDRLGLKGVSRIAVSPQGDRIALVGSP
jgi:hypothetical protein